VRRGKDDDAEDCRREVVKHEARDREGAVQFDLSELARGRSTADEPDEARPEIHDELQNERARLDERAKDGDDDGSNTNGGRVDGHAAVVAPRDDDPIYSNVCDFAGCEKEKRQHALPEEAACVRRPAAAKAVRADAFVQREGG